jgi:hypothetical protein
LSDFPTKLMTNGSKSSQMKEAGTRNVRNMRLHAEVFIKQYSKISDHTHWLNGLISDGEALHVIWNLLEVDGRTEVHAFCFLCIQLQSL